MTSDYKAFVENSPKIDATIKLIAQNKKDAPNTGQIIYSEVCVDTFPMIREYLIKETGYKESEVRIITGATSNNERVKIQEAFNTGEVKVVIGSPAIKEGLNLQGNTTDMYILSLPWNFTQLRQIEGRGWRQGNKWKNIRINYMLTEDSVDVFMLQRLQVKQGLYNAAMKSGAETIDVSDIDTSELKAELIKDPVTRARIAMTEEEAKQNNEISRLKSEAGFIARKTKKYLELRNDLIKDKENLAYQVNRGSSYYAAIWKKQAAKDEEKLNDERAKLIMQGIDIDSINEKLEKIQARIEEIENQQREEAREVLFAELSERYQREREEQLAKSSHSLEDYLQERAKENALGFFEERKKEDEDTLYRDDDSSSMRSVSSGNDDKLAVTTLPASTELPITEVSKSGTSVEKAVQAISELPQKVETLDGVQLNISRATRNKLKNELSKHKDNMDVVAAFSNLEDVVSNSILIEEHRDRIKVNGERKAENPSDANIEKIQRFYGAVSINGKPYRVKSTAIVFKQGNNKMHSYEITKIELLSSSIPTINSQATAPNNNSITLANLLKDVEFSYEKGRKLLDEVANNDDIEKAEQESSKKYRLIEDVKDYVLDLFYRIVGGKSNDTRYTIGTLTAEGREYLQNLTGWDFKPVTKFVLNASDLKHIYNDHFGANEKDPSRNIALNNDDIRNIVDVISNPDRVAHFVDTEHGNRKVLYFFKEAGDGTYNLCEVSSNKKGNLTAKTYYKTKRTAAQRVMDLEQSLLPTSETYFGASPLTGAKIPNLFDMGIADNENFRRNAAENEISVNQTEVDSTKLQSDIDGLVKKMNKTLGLNIVVDDKNDLQDKNDKKAKGWFDTETGEIHLVWNNHSDMTDVERTILHEAVAHKGLRELFGEKFGTFLDNVYRNAEEHIKQTIDKFVSDKGMSRHEATEEYMAGLAEDTNFEQVKHTTWWAKVKSWFTDMLHKLGFENFVTAEKIGNNELRYVLWRSYENLKSGGLHGIFAKAEDMAKQQELKVGDYAEEAVRYRDGEETGQDGEQVKPKGEAEEENFLKDYNAGDATFEEAITEGLLSVAGKHKEDIKARVQATEAIGGQLSKLNRAMRVQKKYDKATVDHIIRLARTILTNGGLDKLTHGEVKRLLSYINKSVGKEAITTQARQVLDLLTEHQLKVCRESLNQLLRIKGKKVNQQGVEVQAGLDVKGQRMLETARAGIALDIDTLEQRMAEAQEKMGSDLAVEAENASIDYEGLMIARRYHELIKDSKEEEKRAFLEILPSYILRLLMQPLNSMTGCAQAG